MKKSTLEMMKFGSLLLLTPLLVVIYTQMESSVARKNVPLLDTEVKAMNVSNPGTQTVKVPATVFPAVQQGSASTDRGLEHKMRFNRLSLLAL